jgi:hypothetical protein
LWGLGPKANTNDANNGGDNAQPEDSQGRGRQAAENRAGGWKESLGFFVALRGKHPLSCEPAQPDGTTAPDRSGPITEYNDDEGNKKGQLGQDTQTLGSKSPQRRYLRHWVTDQLVVARNLTCIWGVFLRSEQKVCGRCKMQAGSNPSHAGGRHLKVKCPTIDYPIETSRRSRMTFEDSTTRRHHEPGHGRRLSRARRL